MAFVCWRNDLLIPLRSAPHACRGDGQAWSSGQLPCKLWEIRRRNSHIVHRTHTLHESRHYVREPSRNRFRSPETGATSKKCRTDWRRTARRPLSESPVLSWLQQAANISSGSLISPLLPLGYADQYASGIKVVVRCCVVTLRQFRRREATLAATASVLRGRKGTRITLLKPPLSMPYIT